MNQMSAVVLNEWGGPLSVERVDVPKPAPGEVRVDVRACNVTRTIENAIQGGLSDDPSLTPRIPGHEFAGVVDACGDGVSNVSVGDRVIGYFYLTCGRCDACRRGETNQCTNFGGWLGVQQDGAYAEQTVVPASNVLPLPDGADFVDGAIAADGLATPLHICRRANVRDVDTVLVIGAAGRIGIHLCQLASLRGANVIAADIDEERLKYVDDLTADSVQTLNASETDFDERVKRVGPDETGPTVVVDTVGHVPTLQTAWEAMAMGGQVVTLTTHHERAFAPLLKDFVVKEASILGTRYATKDEVVRAAQLFADGRITPVVSDTVSLDDVPDVHDRLRSGDTFGTTILEP